MICARVELQNALKNGMKFLDRAVVRGGHVASRVVSVHRRGSQPTSSQPASIAAGRGSSVMPQYLRPSHSATFTRPISTGTSTSGPMTAANACAGVDAEDGDATAMASSKLLLAAVKVSVAVLE